MHEIQFYGDRFPLVHEIGTTFTHKGWIHPNRTTDFNVFIYMVRGQIQVVEDGIEYVFQEGDIGFLKRGVHHWGDPDRSLPDSETIWIHFYDGDEPSAVDKSRASGPQQFRLSPTLQIFSINQYRFGLTLPKVLKLKNPAVVRRKLEELFEISHSYSPFRHLAMSMETMGLFLNLYREAEESDTSGKSDALVTRITSFLESNCDRPLDTEQVRAEFGLNYHYLSTLFSQKSGISIFKYHERLRIQYAAQLLKTTQLNISEVGEKVGYESPYYFSRVFKKVMGESPSEYSRNVYRML